MKVRAAVTTSTHYTRTLRLLDRRSRRDYYLGRKAENQVNGVARREPVTGRTNIDGEEVIIPRRDRDDDLNQRADAVIPRPTSVSTPDSSRSRTRHASKDKDRYNVSDDDFYVRGRPSDRDDVRWGSRRRQIHSIAFGSRAGDYAIIYQDSGAWYLDGNVFERLSTLKDFIIPRANQTNAQGPSRIGAFGGNHRVFLGPENTYFASDGDGLFSHNIQTREFRDWLNQCCGQDSYLVIPRERERERDDRSRERDDRSREPRLRTGYEPHSLALGPDDMFCWISEKDFKVNVAFRNAFPGIERFLEFAKRKKILEQVSFTTSSYPQLGSTLPYFVLSTLSGICVSAVPHNATEIVSGSSTRWGALLSAKLSRDAKKDESRDRSRDRGGGGRSRSRSVGDRTRARPTSREALAEKDFVKLQEAAELANGGLPGMSPYTSNHFIWSIYNHLWSIRDECSKHVENERDELFANATIADKVRIVIEELEKKATGKGDTTEENDATQVLDELWPIILDARHLAFPFSYYGMPKVNRDNKAFAKLVAKVNTDLSLISEICDANEPSEITDGWRKATLGQRVQQIVGDLKRKIKSTEIAEEDDGDDDIAPGLMVAIIMDPEGDLSRLPVLKDLPPESIPKLRKIINDIYRTAENVKRVVGEDDLVSQLSLADQIQTIIAEMMLRGEILQQCDLEVQRFIGPDKDGGHLRLPEKIKLLLSDYAVNYQYLGKLAQFVDEITADDEDVAKMDLADKVNVIMADNLAQAAEFKEIDQLFDADAGVNSYNVPRTDKIKIMSGQRDDAWRRMKELEDQIELVVGSDGYSTADKVKILVTNRQDLAKIAKTVDEFVGKEDMISKMAVPDKVTTIVADNVAKGQELRRYSGMIKDIEEQVSHLKDGDVKKKLKEILKRK